MALDCPPYPKPGSLQIMSIPSQTYVYDNLIIMNSRHQRLAEDTRSIHCFTYVSFFSLLKLPPHCLGSHIDASQVMYSNMRQAPSIQVRETSFARTTTKRRYMHIEALKSSQSTHSTVNRNYSYSGRSVLDGRS
jgi:hypothetical protein